jgi:hypothetical protein
MLAVGRSHDPQTRFWIALKETAHRSSERLGHRFCDAQFFERFVTFCRERKERTGTCGVAIRALRAQFRHKARYPLGISNWAELT